jgi:hypothetical protein
MRRLVLAAAVGLAAAWPAAAQQPGEAALTPFTVADQYRQAEAKDVLARNAVVQMYKTLFDIDPANAADLARIGKEYAVYRAFKDSFGCYRLNVMACSRWTVRPGAPSGGSIVARPTWSRVTLDRAGHRDELNSDDSGASVYTLVLDDHGSARLINKNSVTLTLDPTKSSSVTWSGTAEVGYGLYDGRPATGARPDATRSIPNEADAFALAKAEDADAKVRWLGPTRKYAIHVSLDAAGNWVWKDESMGIDIKGAIK